MSSSPLPAIAHGPLIAYAAADLLQFAMPGFTAAAIVSASGMVAALLVTITVYYLKQVFPPKLRPLAVVVGVGLPHVGTSFARLVPVELLPRRHRQAIATAPERTRLSLPDGGRKYAALIQT